MKVTAIKRQLKDPDRYSIFIDNKYTFSLNSGAMLDSGLRRGMELTQSRLTELKHLSNDNKLYNQALKKLSLRARSEWEIRTYLERKSVSKEQVETILNRLTKAGLLNDLSYAANFVNDRRTFKSVSKRRLIAELKQKHIAGEIIEKVVDDYGHEESNALKRLVERKRRETKYKDNDLKLMQYLARQGFDYGDIKDAVSKKEKD